MCTPLLTKLRPLEPTNQIRISKFLECNQFLIQIDLFSIKNLIKRSKITVLMLIKRFKITNLIEMVKKILFMMDFIILNHIRTFFDQICPIFDRF